MLNELVCIIKSNELTVASHFQKLDHQVDTLKKAGYEIGNKIRGSQDEDIQKERTGRENLEPSIFHRKLTIIRKSSSK